VTGRPSTATLVVVFAASFGVAFTVTTIAAEVRLRRQIRWARR
jgi:hypothetical protein